MFALVSVGGACNPAPVNVATRRLTDVPRGTIQRIAVLPFTSAAGLTAAAPVEGREPLPEHPADTVTRAMRDAMRRWSDWQITDPLVVDEAFRRLYGEVRAPTSGEAQAVGKLLAVDAVLRGQVTEFEERIGTEVGAQRPARVVFAVELLRMPTGEAAWQAEYAESQRALTDNLFNLPGFVRAGAKWVRASELAALGADEVAKRLHTALYGSGGEAAPARGGSSAPP